MDRQEITLITHGELSVHNPLPMAALDEAVGHAGLDPGDSVGGHRLRRAREPARSRRRDTIGFGLVLLRRL